MNNLNLSPEDFENAWKLYEAEKINPLTRENMFKGGIYSILSSRENYQKQMIVFNRLMNNGLDNPESILRDDKRLRNIVRKSGFYNQKIEAIYRLSHAWPKSNLPEEILKDSENGRKKGFDLRERIDREVYGMGYKCASLFLRMCDYLDLAIIDRHVLEGIEELASDFELPKDYKIRGISDKKYLEIEEIIAKLAKENNVETAIMSMFFYYRDSQFKNGFQRELNLGCEFNIISRKRVKPMEGSNNKFKPDRAVQKILFDK